MNDDLRDADVTEEDEATALDVVYAWLGGDRAARNLLLAPEYVALRADIAQALAEQRAALTAERDQARAAVERARALADHLTETSAVPIDRRDAASRIRAALNGPQP